MPLFTLTLDLPEGARDVRISYLIPESALVRIADAGLPPPPPDRPTDEDTPDSEDDDWPDNKYSWPRQFWQAAHIRAILAGSGEPLRAWLRFLAEHPGQIFKMSAICAAIGVPSTSLRGPMSGMGKRMAPFGYRHWFFDTRWNHGGSGEMEYRMRAREARIVIEWFRDADRPQAA